MSTASAVSEIVDDLACGGARVHVRVGLVLELAGHEPAVRLGQFLGLVDHAHAALRRRGQHHLGAEKTHQTATLDAKGFGHRHDQRIALLGAHHRQANAGIAAGGFDDGLAGLEFAALLGRFDHPERQSVLDRAQRVERLDLDVEVYAGGCELVDLDDRRVADSFEDVRVFRHVLVPPRGARDERRAH
jgi:hypothetical protein